MSRKRIALLVFLAVVVVFVVRGLNAADHTVEVVQPRRGTIQRIIEEQATCELPRDSLVSMPIDGWLLPIDLREGDPVAEDAIIARLDAKDHEDSVAKAKQRIAILETELEKSKDDLLENDALIQIEAVVKAVQDSVKAAEAKMGATRALFDWARSESERVSELTESGSTAPDELRRIQLEARQAKARLEADGFELAAMRTIEAVSYIGPKFIKDFIASKRYTTRKIESELVEARTQLAIEERNLARCVLRSPIAGVVLERHRTRHQYLHAGTPLLTLGRLSELEVIAELLTSRATRIRPGATVTILVGGAEGAGVPGKVTRIYPAGFTKISSLGVEQQRVKVAIAFDRIPEALGVGYRVRVRILEAEAHDALILPRSSIYRRPDDSWAVLTVEDERLVEKEVTPGLFSDRSVQITAGLDASAQIVRRPTPELTPGSRVATIP